MSRDSSRSYIHLHAGWHADIFEEFTTAPKTASDSSPQQESLPAPLLPNYLSSLQPTAPGTTNHIPPEDIFVPTHLMPPNPEDEDDVVPDQHAAFGITRAMQMREQRVKEWKDFEGLLALVRGTSLKDGQQAGVSGVGGMPLKR